MNNSGSQQTGYSNEQKHKDYENAVNKTIKKSEKIFLGVTLTVTALFILFLPDMYKFIRNFQLSEMFGGKPVVSDEGPKKPNNNQQEEVKYKAVTCTKIETGDAPYINTTILYFSKNQLKKINRTITYDYKDGYNRAELNGYFLTQQNKLASQKGFEMKINASDEQIYTVNYSLDLATTTNDVLIELEITERLDAGEPTTVNAYQQNGFRCE